MGRWHGMVVGAAPSLALLAATWLVSGMLSSEANWYVIRSAGLVSYGLLTLTTAFGLGVSLRSTLPGLAKPDLLTLHRGSTQLAFALLAVHLGALLGDRFLTFSPATIVGAEWGAYRPLAVWLGSLALWLLLAATAAFALRRRLAAGRWRVWHRVAYGAWLLALAHGVAAGSDSGLPAAQWFYVGSGLAITGLLAYRLLHRTTGPAASNTRDAGPAPRPRPPQARRDPV